MYICIFKFSEKNKSPIYIYYKIQLLEKAVRLEESFFFSSIKSYFPRPDVFSCESVTKSSNSRQDGYNEIDTGQRCTFKGPPGGTISNRFQMRHLRPNGTSGKIFITFWMSPLH